MNKNKIEEYIEISKNQINDLLIIVVGNAQGITSDFKDFQHGTSVVSEYYSLDRFKKIVTTLRTEGFEVIPYYDEMDFIHDYLTKRIRNNYYKKMVVFNFAQKGIAHGRKTLIPLFCEMNNIIHTNSDPFVTSFTREKYLWYKLLIGVANVCDTWIYDGTLGWFDKQPTNGEYVIFKLENQCSSMGMDHNSAFYYSPEKDYILKKVADKYNSRIIVQKFIDGYEVEVPFFCDETYFQCLKPQGIMINNKIKIGKEFLDYNARGKHLFSFYNFDEEFPDITPAILSQTEKIARIINIQGMGRIDFRLDEDLNFFVTDINSNPHLIEVASPCESLRQIGINEYSDLLHLIIGVTINRHPS